MVKFEKYKHQDVGIEELVKWDDPEKGRVYGGCFFLADEMGLGKSFQVIKSAKQLYDAGDIDQVIVVSPAPVRSVWYDEELGELAKFYDAPMRVVEYHAKTREWSRATKTPDGLLWVITNYDFIRKSSRLNPLISKAKAGSAYLVLDESSAVKNWKAAQTKAVKKLRQSCRRVVLLNGTPIAHSPQDLYSQADIMDPRILNCTNYYHFRARYAIMGGYGAKQIVGWRDLDDLQARLKPYILRREKIDCLDLPLKLPPVALEVALLEETWKVYKEMREEMITWLDSGHSVTAAQAGVRAIRLSQITSGFIGGIKREVKCECNFDPSCQRCGGTGIDIKEEPPRAVGSEKHDLICDFLDRRFEAGEKVLVWCRHRFEVARLEVAMQKKGVPVGLVWGGQDREERRLALRLLDPRTAPSGPAVLIGTPGSGSMGLNLTAAWTVVYVSNDHNLKNRLQSMDRVHRHGQIHAVSYFDVIATGPKGQKTIDHTIVKSLWNKEELARFTVSAWKDILIEEAKEK